MLSRKHAPSSAGTESNSDFHTIDVCLDEDVAKTVDEPEGDQQKDFFFAKEEIKREVQRLRRPDEEKHFRMQKYAKNRMRRHMKNFGSDLSLLASQDVSYDVKCVELVAFGLSNNIFTVKVIMPLPMEEEVLIRAHSCGVSVNDVLTRNGRLDNWTRSSKPPFIMGSEIAGEIVGLGKNVTEFKLGDRVMALPERNAWSEYVVCHTELCFKIPEKMSYHEAVALIVDGILAYSLLFHIGNLSRDQAVLLHSSSGGLDTIVTQMARTVANTQIFKITGEEGGTELADPMVHSIEHGADYISEIRHSSFHGVDLVLDCHHDDHFQCDFNLLRPMGKYVLFGNKASSYRGIFDMGRWWWGEEKVPLRELCEANKGIHGFNLRSLLYFQPDRSLICKIFEQVCKMWQTGQITAIFDRILHLDDFNEALQRVQERGQLGKIILDPRKRKGDLLSERDYCVLAEANVGHRQQSVKEPDYTGVLAENAAFVDEEDEHIKQLQHEELMRYDDYDGPGLMPNFFPVGKVSFFKTEESKGPPSCDVSETEFCETVPTNMASCCTINPEPTINVAQSTTVLSGKNRDEPISSISMEEVDSLEKDGLSELDENMEKHLGHGNLKTLHQIFSLQP